MSNFSKVGIIVLAAGPSSRLGTPKQILTFRDKNLLDITTDAAKKVAHGRVVVILGGNYEYIEGNVNHSGVQIVYNPDWEEGMSSSIRLGLQHILAENGPLDGVILSVCDQPFISAGVFEALIAAARTKEKNIFASAYAGTLGVPVLFSSSYFSELAMLSGKEGAKTLLLKYNADLASVLFVNGEIDIDTAEDYDKLMNNSIE